MKAECRYISLQHVDRHESGNALCRAVLQTLVVLCQRDLQCSSFYWLCENVLCNNILKREVDELDTGALVQLPEWRMCTKKLLVQNLTVASGESLAEKHSYWYLMFSNACLVRRRHVWRAFYLSTVTAVAHCFLFSHSVLQAVALPLVS